MALKIGITGPSGSGKSMLCKYLKLHNIPCIDADRVYAQMLIPPSDCLERIKEVFGNEVIQSDGCLDRKKLSKTVFSSKEKLDLLNRTVLPLIILKIKSVISALEKDGENIIAVDAPTLIESGFFKECDFVISVLASKDVRADRITKRDGISLKRAIQRIDGQNADSFYTSVSDFVIYNDSCEEDLFKKAKEIFDGIIKSPQN